MFHELCRGDRRHSLERFLGRPDGGEITRVLLRNVPAVANAHHRLKSLREVVTGDQLPALCEELGDPVNRCVRHFRIVREDDEFCALEPLCGDIEVAHHDIGKTHAVQELCHDIGVPLYRVEFPGGTAGHGVVMHNDDLSAFAKQANRGNIELRIYILAAPGGDAYGIDFAPSGRMALDGHIFLVDLDGCPRGRGRGIEVAPVPPVAAVQVDA